MKRTNIKDIQKELGIEGATKINIGCGRHPMKGYINLDIAKEVNPDILVDIEKEGLPFPDNSIDEIYSSCCLEHIRPQYWSFIMQEIARVSKHKGKLRLVLPFDSAFQRGHADQYRVFTWDSFCDHYYDSSEVLYYGNLILRNLHKRPNIIYRLWYTLFPFMMKGNVIFFEFEIIKDFSDIIGWDKDKKINRNWDKILKDNATFGVNKNACN